MIFSPFFKLACDPNILHHIPLKMGERRFAEKEKASIL
jgi:hypothetical protein|tara:strand:- start:119 stop:232 length:114 start_codon:yes stop_codon:yes gene_type:complete